MFLLYLTRRAFALTVFLAVPASAQTRPVPLDEALETARSRTIEVLRADAQVQAARVAVDAARDRRWPSLSLSAGGGQRYGLSFDQTSGGLTQSTVESVDLGLSTEVVVFDGFERRAAARSAEAGLRAAELGGARAGQAATVAVLRGYLAVALAEAARAVAVEDMAAQENLLAEVRAQVEFGERPAYEVAQQEERVAAARGAVLAAERGRALGGARLVRILGLDPAGAYSFPAPPAAALEPDVPADALVRQAIGSRADLRAAALAVVAAEADRQSARASRLPQITLGGYVGTSFTSAAESVGLPGQLGDNRSGALRVGVSLPVFDRGISRQRVRQAETQVALLRAEEEDARRAVVLDVQERQVELDALRAQAGVADVRVRAAESALAAERARYAAGETTLQTVSLAQVRTVEARAERERLVVEAQFQRLMLAVAVGI